jgi:hypothetical protein
MYKQTLANHKKTIQEEQNKPKKKKPKGKKSHHFKLQRLLLL